MHPVLFFEAFFSCSRDDLERLQPLSQSLLNMIVAGSKVLPLRPIHRVDMDDYYGANIQIFVEQFGERRPDYDASMHSGDFAEIFRRLQHVCVKYFNVGIRESPFLRYWKAQQAAAFTVVIMDFDPPEEKDSGVHVLDSIVNHLRPKTTQEVAVYESSWRENGYRMEYLELLARDSFLNRLQTCRLKVEENGFPPPTFFLNERGYPNYELSCNDCRVADGIDGFIESFVRDGCANEKLESVYITWDASSNEPRLVPKQLSKPTKADMPLPNIHLTAPLTRYNRVTRCETHSFVNTTQWKRMDVYEWRAVYHSYFGRGRTPHILQCRVTDI